MTSVRTAEANQGPDSFTALAGLDQAAIDALPQAVYLCADDGRVIRYNRRAAELWGRTPTAGDPEVRFCGSQRLYRTDGSWLPHDQCPMATALLTGESFLNQEVVVERPNGERLTVLVNIAALRGPDGNVNGAINCFQDISAKKREEDRQRHLVEELNHRVKNTLAMVHSLAVNTARGADSVPEFTRRFEARLLALSQAHGLLSDSRRSNAELRDLLAQQLEPFAGGGRVRFEGPEVDLQPRLAFALTMVFHELMTNAAKYGALSVASGSVSIEWDLLSGPDGGDTLALRWAERDGPAVKTPERSGFGTRLIKRTLADGLGGEAHLRFEPSGLQFSLTIPVRN